MGNVAFREGCRGLRNRARESDTQPAGKARMGTNGPERTAEGRPLRLQCLREFLRECALRTLSAPWLALRAASAVRATRFATTVGYFGGRGSGGALRAFRLRRLRGIRPKQPLFKRRPVETPDDGIHFLLVRRFDERESFGLLGFRVPYYFYVVGHEIICGEPRLDVVSGHPQREISKEDGITHSEVLFAPFSDLGNCFRGMDHGSNFILSHDTVGHNAENLCKLKDFGDFERSRGE